MKVAIIGGGASGLAAAITIKREKPEIDVTILEKLDTVGKKSWPQVTAVATFQISLYKKSATTATTISSTPCLMILMLLERSNF